MGKRKVSLCKKVRVMPAAQRSKRRSVRNGREELVTQNGMSVSHRDMSEVWEKSNIWETAKGHRKNTEDAVRIRDGSAHRSICNARSYQATSFGHGLGCWAKPAVPAEAPPSAFASGMERSGSLIERLPIS